MNSEQIANVLAFYAYYHPKENVDQIAEDIKLPVSLIVNGLYAGDRLGLFKSVKVGPQFKEINVIAVPDDTADFGKDMERVKEIMLEVVSNVNSDKKDITDDNLFIWIGAPLVISKVGVQLLLNEGKLVKYRITDPKDPKSKYHFLTLPENKEEMFGRAEFKRKPSKKNIKRHVSVSRRKR
jgi:aromatic ring-cleaving dioxygenase